MKKIILSILIIICSLISGIIGAGIYEFMNIFPISQNITSQTSSPISLSPSLSELEAQITTTVSSVSPSVVSIIIEKDLVVYRSDPWGFFQTPSGTVNQKVGGGTGFFIKSDGTILTNKHVVSDSEANYTVILSDGSEYDATVLALDPISDLAIIKIDSENDVSFPALSLRSQEENVVSGEFALAVGNALAEFQNSVSLGIISGTNRSIEAQGEVLSGLLQTDAAINPGNSGGPLMTLDGKVVGINTAIVSQSNNIGFAIELSKEKVEYMLDSIEKNGRIMRPFIGINYIPITPSIASQLNLGANYGAYITQEDDSVVQGSSAENIGLEAGDIILEIDGVKIEGQYGIISAIQNEIPGKSLSLKVLKKSGKTENLTLELGEY